ncbi:hypothetical protein V500_05855 [Pseudogymnoascus sp. VKM F-4518 (FW-2643)]|nr:hypothetical protein V500_05855 [Pseudogymnoascus sp. VKM F-4518 (FW-2643)]
MRTDQWCGKMVACKIAVIALAISYAQETASDHAESMPPYKASIDDLRSISASEDIEIEISSKIGALLIILKSATSRLVLLLLLPIACIIAFPGRRGFGGNNSYISKRSKRSNRNITTLVVEYYIPFDTMKSDNLAIARFNSSSPSSTRTTSDVALQTPEESEAARLYDFHLSLLRPGPTQQSLQEVTTAPIFTMPVLKHAEAIVDGKSLPKIPTSHSGNEPFIVDNLFVVSKRGPVQQDIYLPVLPLLHFFTLEDWSFGTSVVEEMYSQLNYEFNPDPTAAPIRHDLPKREPINDFKVIRPGDMTGPELQLLS